VPDEAVIGLDAELRIDQFERSLAAYQAALDSATDATANAAEHINDAGDQADQAVGGVNNLATAFYAGLGSALADWVIPKLEEAFTALAHFTDAAAQEEQGIARLGAAVRATGADWDTASAEIETYITAQQRATDLDDGEAREALIQLTTITGDYHTALALLPVAMDMAAARGQSLTSTAQVLARVAEGNTGILRRYGIILEEGASATEAIAAITEKFGGQAEAMAGTVVGANGRMSVAFGNVKESIGSIFLPAIAAAKNGVADFVQAALPGIDAFSGVVGSAMETAAGQVGAAFRDMLNVVGLGTDDMAGAAQRGGLEIGYQLAEGIGAMQAISDVISWWLEPASPPEVAADVDEWGAELVYIYADGIAAAADSTEVKTAVSAVQTALAESLGLGGISSDLETDAYNQAARAQRSLIMQMATTPEKIGMVQDELGGLTAGTADYYEALGTLYTLQQQYADEQQAAADAEEAAARAMADAEQKAADDAAQAAADAQEAKDQASEAEWQYQYAIADTSGKLKMQKERLGETEAGTADYYDTLTQVYELERQRADELETLAQKEADAAAEQQEAVDAVTQAQWDYQYAIADTATKLAMQRERLASLDEGTVEYYKTLTDVYDLEQQVAAETEAATSATDRGAAANTSGAAAAKAAAAAADALADAELRYRLATASAAEKVEILRGELAKLTPGTTEWYAMATQLATAEAALAKETGGAGKATLGLGTAVETAVAGISKLDFAARLAEIFDPKRLATQTETIRSSIVNTLRPIFEESGGDLAAFLGDGFRAMIATALFGPITRTQMVQVSPGEWVAETIQVGNDATWTEVGKGIKDKLGQVIADALTGLGVPPSISQLMGDNWIAILVATLVANSPLISTMLGTAIGGTLAKAIGFTIIGGSGLIKGAVTGLANWLWLNIGVALEGAFGTGMAGLGVTLTGLTLATLLPVIFPEETGDLVDKAYLWCNEHIAQPIQDWFTNDLPGIISGLPPIFNPETKEFEPIQWADVLDEIGLTTTWETIKTKWAEGTADIGEAWNGAYLIVSDTATEWLADMGINANDTWLVITTAWANTKTDVTASWSETKADVEAKAAEWYTNLVTWGDDTWSDITTTWNSIETDVTTSWDSTYAAVSLTAATWYAAMVLWGDNTWLDVTTTWAAIKNDVALYWNQAWTAVSTTCATWFAAMVLWGYNTWLDVTTKWSTIKADVSLYWSQAKADVMGTAGAWWASLILWGSDVKSSMSYWWSEIKASVTGLWSSARDDVKGTAADLKAGVEAHWNGLTDFLRSAYQSIYDAAVSPFKAAYDFIMSLLANWPSIPTVPPAGGGGDDGGSGGAAVGAAQTTGGAYVVGERGPELVQPPQGSRIYSMGDSVGLIADYMAALPAQVSAMLMGRAGAALAYAGRDLGAAAAQAAAAPSSGVTVNVGPVTIANNMDQARFVAMVRRAVADAI
jgi:hypothetical protein